MDQTDMRLIMLLSANSRLSYAELAEKLNLSVNAVHKRIQLLIEAGVIRKFTARLSLLATKAFVVYIFGDSQLSSFQGLPERLKAQGSISWLAIGGGKFLYVGAYLREITELDQVVNYLKKEAGMLEPTVGIMAPQTSTSPVLPKQLDTTLYDLDYQIIRSLKDNSRKPISEVAEELQVSAKTARRRLSRMIKNWLIELSIEWYPDASNDIMTLVELHYKPEADANLLPSILKKYSPHTLFYWQFLNIPNVATYTVWTNTMKKLQSIRESLEREEGVVSVVPNILYTGYVFDTWRDQLVEK
jgi:Lrp/AsnC family leucine-responsive transcriptional regulator